MIIFNYLDSLIFYSLVLVTVSFIGFSVCYSINNVNDNVTDSNVDTSSNNVNSDAGSQTEDPSLSVATTNLSYSSYPVHEAKYQELLPGLIEEMQNYGINPLCLRYLIHSYTLEQLNLDNINAVLIMHFKSYYFYRIP